MAAPVAAAPAVFEREREKEREREREGTWWAHTGGGNALAFKQPT
jgi:hypothetical protein